MFIDNTKFNEKKVSGILFNSLMLIIIRLLFQIILSETEYLLSNFAKILNFDLSSDHNILVPRASCPS